MKEISYNKVSIDVRKLLTRVKILNRHIETSFYDPDRNIFKIVLKEKYRMGSDPVFLDAESLRLLYRESIFVGIGAPDRREGLILFFNGEM